MNDLFLVRVVNGVADRTKQFKTCGNVELMRVAITVEWLALDELHHEVGQAVVSCTAVEESGDVRVIERGENLSFFTKATQDEVGIHTALHQFDCRSLIEFVISA